MRINRTINRIRTPTEMYKSMPSYWSHFHESFASPRKPTQSG